MYSLINACALTIYVTIANYVPFKLCITYASVGMCKVNNYYKFKPDSYIQSRVCLCCHFGTISLGISTQFPFDRLVYTVRTARFSNRITLSLRTD